MTLGVIQWPQAALTALLAMLCIGCTTFRGPGEFAGHGGYRESSRSGPGSAQTRPQNGVSAAERTRRNVIVADQDENEHESDELPENAWRSRNAGGVERLSEDIAFDWPVEAARLTQPFRPRKKRPHLGIDLGGPKGTQILAAESGYVIYTGRGFRGFGNLIVIEHNSSWATLYSHLHTIDVEEGQFVKKGDVIGGMGRTGRASGVHLHFEIRHNRRPVNPQAYLPAALGHDERTTASEKLDAARGESARNLRGR